jgi:alpha-galactosidase
MRIESFIDTKGLPGISGLHAVIGSFGTVDGDAEYTRNEREGKVVYEHTTETVKLTAEFTVYDNGAVIRRDTLENISDKPVTLHKLMMRFHMDGNEYDVYTQFSGWQHESSGDWQRLVTEIGVGSTGIRACDSAAPIMALSNRYTGRNTVFHLMTNGQWRITARKLFYKDREMVSVEMGLTDVALSLDVDPGEVIELPTVIFFNVESKIDLDAYKLHEVYNELYPRKCIPIVYNSWLYCFDKLNIDDLKIQASCAKDLGIEAFMIDAGWFGDGEGWWSSVGDWEENLTSGPCGRLGEL